MNDFATYAAVDESEERIKSDIERLLSCLKQAKPGVESEEMRLLLARVALCETSQPLGLLDTSGNLWEAHFGALGNGGMQRADLHGKPFWSARCWQNMPQIQEQLRDDIRRAALGETIRTDVDIPAGDWGPARWTQLSFKPIRNRSGDVICILWEGRDVTAVKSLQKQLTEASEQIKGAVAMAPPVFAELGHELRAPLTMILGTATQLLADPGLDPQTRLWCEQIQRNTRTVLQHLNDMLDIANLDAGRTRMAYYELDLSRLFERVADDLRGFALEKQIQLTVIGTGQIEADPPKLSRVINNLLSNAIKFTPPGGRIACACRMLDGRIELAVDDSGPGIPAAARTHVFERGGHLGSGLAARWEGPRLGLSIVKEFVRLHGGEISVEKSELGGARFRVLLPQHAPAGVQVRRTGERRPQPSLFMAEVAGDKLRTSLRSSLAPFDESRPAVLLVEDNDDIRRLAAETLSERFRVLEAVDGRSALDLLKEHLPEIIITDITMPNFTGERLLESLKDHRVWRDIPVILMSAATDADARNTLLAKGADDYVDKPFRPQELMVRVENIFAAKRASDQIRRMSVTDPLTGLFTRRYFDEEMPKEIQRCSRAGIPLAVVLVDVDRFKEYNTKAGYEAGDLVLHDLANIISGHTRRPGEFVARYGGEEYALVLPGTSAAEAAAVAEQVRAAVEMRRIPYPAPDTRFITVSVGYTAVTHWEDVTADRQVLATADEALMQAKRSGRNRVFQRDLAAA